MKRILLLLALIAAPATAQLSENDLARAVTRPPPGARLPAALAFADQNGTHTTLGQVAAGRPLVLIFADYTCRHICGPGLTLTAGALHDSGLVANQDYTLATIGIDPKDSLADARNMRARIAGTPASVLTGTAAAIAAATHALGYGYAYDATNDQFAHDASVYVFAADGHLAALLPEIGLSPDALKAAISSPQPAPSLAEQVAHICYGFATLHGRYGRPVMLAMQALTALLAAGAALLLWRRRRPA